LPTFAISAYKEPASLRRLVHALSPYPVVVHVDKQSNIDAFLGLPRTRYIKDRVAVHWCGYSLTEANLRMLEQAVDITEANDHVVILSGQCHPVRPLDEFIEFLKTSTWRQHCRAALVFDGTSYGENRLSRKWFYDTLPLRRDANSRRLVSALRRTLGFVGPRLTPQSFHPLRPVFGSCWIALTGECLQDLLPHARQEDYIRLFRNALAPDEMFFQTLVYNTSWRAQTQTPTFESRGTRQTHQLNNFHYLVKPLSRTLTLDDLDPIRQSKMYFARKFDDHEGFTLLERLGVI
jgi:hypothetical protein